MWRQISTRGALYCMRSNRSCLRPGCCPFLLVDLLACFPEACRNPCCYPLRFRSLQDIFHTGDVLDLREASLLLLVVRQVALPELSAKPRPELLNRIQTIGGISPPTNEWLTTDLTNQLPDQITTAQRTQHMTSS